MAIVYRHRRLDTNSIFYVGISKSNKYRPYSKHNRSKHWLNIINKTEYIVEIIYSNISYDDAKELEILLISEYGRHDLGSGLLVNLTDGGEGTSNYVKTIEECKHHSEVLKKKYKGSGNPFYGKKHTEETKNFISEYQKQYFTYEDGDYSRITKKKYNDSTNNKRSKKVINIRTNIVFNNLREASEYYDINYYVLKSRMRGERALRNELKYLEK